MPDLTPDLAALRALAEAAKQAVLGPPDNYHAGIPVWTALDDFREAVEPLDTTILRLIELAELGALDVERLARAIHADGCDYMAAADWRHHIEQADGIAKQYAALAERP